MKRFITVCFTLASLLVVSSGTPPATAQTGELCDQMRETWKAVCDAAIEAAGSASTKEERDEARRLARACSSHASAYASVCLPLEFE